MFPFGKNDSLPLQAEPLIGFNGPSHDPDPGFTRHPEYPSHDPDPGFHRLSLDRPDAHIGGVKPLPLQGLSIFELPGRNLLPWSKLDPVPGVSGVPYRPIDHTQGFVEHDFPQPHPSRANPEPIPPAPQQAGSFAEGSPTSPGHQYEQVPTLHANQTRPGPARASRFVDPKTGKFDYWGCIDAGMANLGKGGALLEDDTPELLERNGDMTAPAAMTEAGAPHNARMPEEKMFQHGAGFISPEKLATPVKADSPQRLEPSPQRQAAPADNALPRTQAENSPQDALPPERQDAQGTPNSLLDKKLTIIDTSASNPQSQQGGQPPQPEGQAGQQPAEGSRNQTPGQEGRKPQYSDDFIKGWLLDLVKNIAPGIVPDTPDMSNGQWAGQTGHAIASHIGKHAAESKVPRIGVINDVAQVVGTTVDALVTGQLTEAHVENYMKVILPAVAALIPGGGPLIAYLIAEDLMMRTLKDKDGNLLFPPMSEEEQFYDWYR